MITYGIFDSNGCKVGEFKVTSSLFAGDIVRYHINERLEINFKFFCIDNELDPAQHSYRPL